MTMRNPFESVGRFAKQAAMNLDPASYQALLASKGTQDIMNVGLAGLGAGAAVRGGIGLLNLFHRATDPPAPKYPGAIVTPVPFPVEDDDDEKPAPGMGTKQAFITDKANFPWYIPGVMAAGGLGLYGGWKGVDALLNKRRQKDLDEETGIAKQDFEDALLSSYSRPRTSVKTAGAELGDLLDQLFDKAVEKQAFSMNPLNWMSDDTKGAIGGVYGAYALGMGGLAGYLAYQKANKGSNRNVLDAAMNQRMRRAYNQRPSEVLAVPQPVRRSAGQVDSEPEDAAEVKALLNEEDSAAASSPTAAPRKRRVDVGISA